MAAELGVSISIRTILLAAVVVAAGAALASIKSVLFLLFVSVFSVAVLSPVATAMERRLGWSRRVCSMVLGLGIDVVIAAVALVMVQAVATQCAASAMSCRTSSTRPGTAISAMSSTRGADPSTR